MTAASGGKPTNGTPETTDTRKIDPQDIDPNDIPENLYPKSQTGGGAKLSELRDQLEKAKEVAKKAQEEAEAQEAALPAMTVASTLGEIVWLMSQSPTHKHFAISDLEWMIMPPILLRQFKIFRDLLQALGRLHHHRFFLDDAGPADQEKIVRAAIDARDVNVFDWFHS